MSALAEKGPIIIDYNGKFHKEMDPSRNESLEIDLNRELRRGMRNGFNDIETEVLYEESLQCLVKSNLQLSLDVSSEVEGASGETYITIISNFDGRTTQLSEEKVFDLGGEDNKEFDRRVIQEVRNFGDSTARLFLSSNGLISYHFGKKCFNHLKNQKFIDQ